ncbi:glycoside hydrolase [bacterium]|nr:glycoside hydrolase [bacterium]
MKKLGAIVVATLLVSVNGVLCQTFDKNIVGYFVQWGIYARDYHVPDIPADEVNVINYAFANISEGQIVLGDPYADIDRFYPGDCWDPGCERGSFHQLQILKEAYPHLKTMISVGGWIWSHYFSELASTEESRVLFAASCVTFIQEWGFDGVDIDWEYPVSGGLPTNLYSPEDRVNFTLLLAELRSQLDAAGDYLLTIAAPAGPEIIVNIEVELIYQYLDWINIMTYDFHGPWGSEADSVTNFLSALYPSEEDPLEEPFHSYFNLSAAVQTYLDLGVPSGKLHAGLPFYGRGYANVADANNGLFVGWSGLPPGTWENGTADYWDLEQNYIDVNGYTEYWHEEAMVPWVFNPATQVMYSYENPASITAKVDYVLSQDLGGIMFWEFSGDKFDVLLSAAYEELNAINETCDLPGDVTGDDELNILDIVSLVGYILGSISDLNQEACADVNFDSQVTVQDVVLLVNIILEINP